MYCVRDGNGTQTARPFGRRIGKGPVMRFFVMIVCIAVGYYITLYLISALKRQGYWIHHGYRPGNEQYRDPPYRQTESGNPEERYMQILGVTKEDGPGDIKRKYKDLLSKYHPDKVQHLGVEFQEMAENKTRKIVEAYEFFRKKYRI